MNSLSEQLKKETRDAHREAEKTGVVHDLLIGRAEPQDYELYLINLLEIYKQLELSLEALPEDSPLRTLARPELYRTGALQRDLDLTGSLASEVVGEILEETLDYTRAIVRAANHKAGVLLIAHAYVRYLGDLSGGQILAQVVQRSMAFPGCSVTPTAFYQFPTIADIDQYKLDYKFTLDELGDELGCHNEIVAEAQSVFALNRRLSEAVSLSRRKAGRIR